MSCPDCGQSFSVCGCVQIEPYMCEDCGCYACECLERYGLLIEKCPAIDRQREVERWKDFALEFSKLVNRHGIDNAMSTPDHVIAISVVSRMMQDAGIDLLQDVFQFGKGE